MVCSFSRVPAAAPRLRGAALALVTLATAGPGLAQAPAAPKTVQLTLAQALRQALDQNPRVHLSLLAIAESGDDRRAAAAALMPTVAAQAMGQRA